MNKKTIMSEEKIRPRKLFDRFLELSKQDSGTFFKKVKSFRMKCPACLSDKTDFSFKKNSFSYEVCLKCKTLFVNPRPKPKVFNDYYRNSESMKFVSEHLYKKTKAQRKEMIFKPKIKILGDLLSIFYGSSKNVVLVDIGAGDGTFCHESLKTYKNISYAYAIEPSTHMVKAYKNKKIKVISKSFESVDSCEFGKTQKKIFTCFELVEHLADPQKFFTACKSIMKPNEIFIFTTLNGLGFDIQLLWEKSKSIFPPHHLNFFNPLSIRRLLERLGFEIVGIETPGRIDWDIVERMINHEGLSLGRFWDYLAKNDDSARKQELQAWISKNKLSSHMRVIARKIK